LYLKQARQGSVLGGSQSSVRVLLKGEYFVNEDREPVEGESAVHLIQISEHSPFQDWLWALFDDVAGNLQHPLSALEKLLLQWYCRDAAKKMPPGRFWIVKEKQEDGRFTAAGCGKDHNGQVWVEQGSFGESYSGSLTN